jgi:hypothetical protein
MTQEWETTSQISNNHRNRNTLDLWQLRSQDFLQEGSVSPQVSWFATIGPQVVLASIGYIHTWMGKTQPAYTILQLAGSRGIRGLTPEGHTEELQGRHVPVRSKAFRVSNEGAQVFGTCGKICKQKNGFDHRNKIKMTR